LSNHDGCRARLDTASLRGIAAGFEKMREIHDFNAVLVHQPAPGPDLFSPPWRRLLLPSQKLSETMT
jgi:hypothetical protein